jgi:hypothetical protein
MTGDWGVPTSRASLSTEIEAKGAMACVLN